MHPSRRLLQSLHVTGDLIQSAKQGLPKIGAQATLERRFTIQDTTTFGGLSGDTNPLHLDAEYVRTTTYEKPVVHGILGAGLFSAIFGSQLPGAVYVSQTLQFKAPMYIDEKITAQIQVERIRERVRVLVCRTTCTKEDGTIAIDGQAQVLLPSFEKKNSKA